MCYGVRMEWWQRLRAEIEGQRDQRTAEQIADAAGIPYAVLRSYVTGRTKDPRGERMRRLAAALGVRIEWLRYGTGERASSPALSSATGPRLNHVTRDVPVLAAPRTGGPQRVICLAERAPCIVGASDVYCVFAPDDSMAPRYHAGEVVYIHPSRPSRPGDYVVAELPSGPQIGRLSPDGRHLITYQPARETALSQGGPPFHRILTPNELAGV